MKDKTTCEFPLCKEHIVRDGFCIGHAKYFAGPKPEKKKKADKPEKITKAEMDLFWLTAANEIEKHPYCVECGTFIPAQFYRHATAHVLPKRKDYGFPSVASNLNNYLVLGSGCGCHGKYDSNWEDAATMKVFTLATEKVRLLYPLIAKEERKNLPDVFRQEIEA